MVMSKRLALDFLCQCLYWKMLTLIKTMLEKLAPPNDRSFRLLAGSPVFPCTSLLPCAGPPGRTGGPSLCSEGGEDGSGVAGAAEAPST